MNRSSEPMTARWIYTIPTKEKNVLRQPKSTPQEKRRGARTHHDGPRSRLSVLARTGVLEIEVLRQLEVELDRRNLVLSLEGVRDGNVDLGSVELQSRRRRKRVGFSKHLAMYCRKKASGMTYGSVLRSDHPLALLVLVELLGQDPLGVLPHLEVAHVLLGVSGRQPELGRQAKARVDLVDELEQVLHLAGDLHKDTTREAFGRQFRKAQDEERVKEGRGRRRRRAHLVGRAEDVRVILDEPPNPRQPAQAPTALVAVQHSKFGHPQRKLLDRPRSGVKDEAVPRAVHRLERKLVLVDVEQEHVVLVVLVVAGRLPEVDVEHRGRHDCKSDSEKQERWLGPKGEDRRWRGEWTDPPGSLARGTPPG